LFSWEESLLLFPEYFIFCPLGASCAFLFMKIYFEHNSVWVSSRFDLLCLNNFSSSKPATAFCLLLATPVAHRFRHNTLNTIPLMSKWN
jgi:hypothetical protein